MRGRHSRSYYHLYLPQKNFDQVTRFMTGISWVVGDDEIIVINK